MNGHLRVFAIVLTVAAAGCQTANRDDVGQADVDLPYSFDRAPYIHPRIVQNLSTMLSDSGDQVVAVNLVDSQNSNRYFGPVGVVHRPGKHASVRTGEDGEAFGYRYVGRTASGIHVLHTSEWGGGSGVFNSLMLLAFEYDRGIDVNWDELTIRPGEKRLLIKKLGEIPLGDRWDGELRVDGDRIFIGEDQGWFTVSGGAGGGPLSYDLRDRILRTDLQ